MSNPRILDALRFYRGMGFFAVHSSLTDEELAMALDQGYQDLQRAQGFTEKEIRPFPEPGPVPPPEVEINFEMGELPDPHPEVSLLSMDDARVWWEDMETDYCPDQDDFIRLLTGWSRISQGAFMPTNIQEHWPEDSVMYLEFDLNGKRHKIVPWKTMPLPPREGFGWTDMDMVLEINNLIRDSGYTFCIADFFDQTAFMFVARLEDKKRMEVERGWKFVGSEV